MKRLAPVGVLVAGALTLSACGNSGSGTADADSLTVVTSTNVYADIVSEVAGDGVKVTPIIDDPNKDPHSYEASSQDQLTLSEADLVVQNGGGYDAFITTMLEALDNKPHVIDAVSVSGLPGSEDVSNEPHDHGAEEHADEGASEAADDHADHDHADEGATEAADDHADHDHADEAAAEDDHAGHDHGEFNEHVWYSVPTMIKVVDEVETELSELKPDSAEAFKKNADDLRGKLEGIVSDIEGVKKTAAGKKSSATEPVPLWLFEDMGIENITPPEFLEAVEEGNDVSPTVLKDAQDQVKNKEVDILAYNTQATSEQADTLKQTADEAGVPVVDMAETMPEGVSYTEWMSGYVSDVQSALS